MIVKILYKMTKAELNFNNDVSKSYPITSLYSCPSYVKENICQARKYKLSNKVIYAIEIVIHVFYLIV